MSQQPRVARIAGSAEQVINQLQAQCPNLAHMMVGSLAAMTKTGSRQVTLDFHLQDPEQQVDITITEDSITIKRGSDETEQNHKAHKADPQRDGGSVQKAVASKKPKTRHARPHERRGPKRARRMEKP